MTRLRRTRPGDAGYRRVRRGRGVGYVDPDGEPVGDPAVLERVRALAIPPAWTDVWIAIPEHAHIQATGVDAAGRRQYLYHPAWRVRADREKFDRMLELARVLPGARRAVTRDLRRDELDRDRVLAGAFRLLDSGALRVGSERYADEHGSYGLTTLLGAHVRFRENAILLAFPAKSGQVWSSELHDPDLARLLAQLRRGPRSRLFAWRGDGRVRVLRAEEINEDLRRRLGGAFSAKDFRTLRGSAVAARSLARAGIASSVSGRRRVVAAAMRDVADALGNTPAVSRASYVDPRIVDRYEHGEVIDPARAVEPQLVTLLR